MDIKQLRYFLAIVEEGQITSAAEKLQMTQPPLSQQLKLLEDELGVKLVERGPRHIKVTEAGKILVDRARQILELTNSTINEVRDFDNNLRGTLYIGTVSSSGGFLLNKKMVEFNKSYPGIRFEIQEGNTFKLMDLLDKGIIEVGIVRTPFNALNFECRYSKSEEMIAAIPKSYLGNDSKQTISIEELRDKPLIFYRRFEQLIYEVFLEHGFEPNIFCKNEDARTTLLWANAGLGIAIVPKSAFNLVSNDNLVAKEIDSEKLKTQIATIWVKDKYISSAAEKFIEFFNRE